MTDAVEPSFEATFGTALMVAETHLNRAIAAGGELGPYVAMAMIEAAVNSAVDVTSHDDVVDMLRELANQVEGAAKEDA